MSNFSETREVLCWPAAQGLSIPLLGYAAYVKPTVFFPIKRIALNGENDIKK